MPVDKWNYPQIYQRKTGGFIYELSNDPNNDDFFDTPEKMSKSDGGWKWANYDSIRPKGCRDPNFDGIGCDMSQGDAHKRGYGWKKSTDLRDIELKFAVKVNSSGGADNDYTIQVITGRHTTPQPCHEGSAYGMSVEYHTNPVTFRWSKEQAHSEYTYKARFTKTSFLNDAIEGLGRYVGLGIIRFNTDNGVKLIFIGNPNPDANPKNWMTIAETEDVGGWGDHNAKDYGADNKDQILDWAMPVAFRIKMTDPDLNQTLKNLTVFEIDPVPAGTGGGGGDTGGGGGDTGEGTGGTGGGSTPTVTYGFAELQIRRHINFEASSPCSAGLATLYDQQEENGDTNLDAVGDRTGMRCSNTSAKFYNKIIRTGLVYLEKHGAGQNVFIKIRRGTDNSIARSMATISAASIGTGQTECSFSDLTNTYRMKINDRITIESDGTPTDYISVYRHDTIPYDQPNTRRFTRLDTSTEWKDGALRMILTGLI